MHGGTAQLHQQLVFRPVPGRGRASTPVAGLYLASASAHPGGGVHGACGANAARLALRRGFVVAGASNGGCRRPRLSVPRPLCAGAVAVDRRRDGGCRSRPAHHQPAAGRRPARPPSPLAPPPAAVRATRSAQQPVHPSARVLVARPGRASALAQESLDLLQRALGAELARRPPARPRARPRRAPAAGEPSRRARAAPRPGRRERRGTPTSAAPRRGGEGRRPRSSGARGSARARSGRPRRPATSARRARAAPRCRAAGAAGRPTTRACSPRPRPPRPPPRASRSSPPSRRTRAARRAPDTPSPSPSARWPGRSRGRTRTATTPPGRRAAGGAGAGR